MFYHWIYHNGYEKELIPQDIRHNIPRSTYAYWRKKPCKESQDYDEFHKVYENHLLQLQQEIARVKILHKRQLIEVKNLTKGLIDIIGKDLINHAIRDNQQAFVNCLEQNSHYIPRKQALHSIGISTSSYYDWRYINSVNCTTSSIGLCSVKHSNQLSEWEVDIIKNSLENDLFNNWALKKICLYLCKHVDDFFVGKTTYYKYANRILGKEGVEKRRIRRKHYAGIRATAPNQLWQIDITHLRSITDGYVYLYCIIDNYSRKILAWKLSQKVAEKKIVGQLIVNCLNELNPQDIMLLTDGGPENDNRFLQRLFYKHQERTGDRIQHFIAFKDIMKSNSMIERVFKSLKYEFDLLDIPLPIKYLQSHLEQSICTYNYEMPQGTFDYRTPDEVYRGIPTIDLRWKKDDVRITRKNLNRSKRCSSCNCNI